MLILYPQKGQRGSPRFLESLNSEALKADIKRPLLKRLKQPINLNEEVICHKIYAFIQLAKTTLNLLLRIQIKFEQVDFESFYLYLNNLTNSFKD